MNAIAKIAELFIALLKIFTARQQAKENQEHQKNVEQVERDPVDFFDDHFNAGSVQYSDATAANADPGKASAAEHNQEH